MSDVPRPLPPSADAPGSVDEVVLDPADRRRQRAGRLAVAGGFLLGLGSILPWISGEDSDRILKGVSLTRDGVGLIGSRAALSGGDGLVILLSGAATLLVGVLLLIGRTGAWQWRVLAVAAGTAGIWTWLDASETGSVPGIDGTLPSLSPGVGVFVAAIGVVLTAVAAGTAPKPSATDPVRRGYAVGGAVFVAGVMMVPTAIYLSLHAYYADAEGFTQVRAGRQVDVRLSESGSHTIWVEHVQAAAEEVTTTTPGAGDPTGELQADDGVLVAVVDESGTDVPVRRPSAEDYQITRDGMAVEGAPQWEFSGPSGTYVVEARSADPLVLGVAVGPTPPPHPGQSGGRIGLLIAAAGLVVMLVTWRREGAA